MRDNRTGELLVAPDLTTMKQTIVRANRNALRHWIADCGEDELDVRYGHKLRRIEGKLGDITAVFENHAKYKGSLVIAADGVNSTSMYPFSSRSTVCCLFLSASFIIRWTTSTNHEQPGLRFFPT